MQGGIIKFQQNFYQVKRKYQVHVPINFKVNLSSDLGGDNIAKGHVVVDKNHVHGNLILVEFHSDGLIAWSRLVDLTQHMLGAY